MGGWTLLPDKNADKLILVLLVLTMILAWMHSPDQWFQRLGDQFAAALLTLLVGERLHSRQADQTKPDGGSNVVSEKTGSNGS